MSPTSYQTALPRDQFRVLLFLCPVIGLLLPLPFDELLPITIGTLPRDQFRVLLFLCLVIGQLLPLPFDELLPIAIGTLPRDQFLIALYYSTADSPISRG